MDDSRSLLPPSQPNSGPIANQLSAFSSQPSAHPVHPPAHPEDEREALLIKLLFAAQRLAASHVNPYGFTGRICTLCSGTGVGRGAIEHFSTCDAGLIESLITRIAALYEQQVDRIQAEMQAPAAGIVEFAEPWRVDPAEPGNVRTAEGLLVLDGFGSELFGSDEAAYAARIVACVNACAGIPTEGLIRNAQRPPAAEDLHGQDALFGQKAPARADWVIQRCTQKWKGTELLYEDFPTAEGLMTRSQGSQALARVERDNPDSEFRLHRLAGVERFEYPQAEGGAQ